MKKVLYSFIAIILFSCKKEKQVKAVKQPLYIKIQAIDNNGVINHSNITYIK